MHRTFFKFVLVGCANTFIYYGIYLVLLDLLDVHYFAAHLLAFAASLVLSFFLNTHFTYNIQPTWRRFVRYPLTQLANTVMTSLLLFLFVEQFGLSPTLAPIAALFFTVPITFILTGKILKAS